MRDSINHDMIVIKVRTYGEPCIIANTSAFLSPTLFILLLFEQTAWFHFLF